MGNPIYISQLAFTTGEVSPDVSSRFDLDQYKSAFAHMGPLQRGKAANM